MPTQSVLLGMLRRDLDIFVMQKASVGSNPHWLFVYEAFRRMAAFSIQLAGNHTRLASRETRCRAAVKPRPTGMSLYAPARQGRAEMGAGL